MIADYLVIGTALQAIDTASRPFLPDPHGTGLRHTFLCAGKGPQPLEATALAVASPGSLRALHQLALGCRGPDHRAHHLVVYSRRDVDAPCVLGGGPCVSMGLLSIIKKVKQKEREMRLLMV